MASIAYILLCHKDVDSIIAQVRLLTAPGDMVAIHFDARAPRRDFDRLRAAFAGDPRVTFASRRLRCGWGEWSLVGATLEAVRAAVTAFPAATHFYMLSGDCMPIKPAGYAHRFLDDDDADFIESFDFFDSDWIRTGLKEDRLIYRHWFNERTQKSLFYASYNIQKTLRLRRAAPADIRMMIGSQWWCLRRRTIEAVLDFCARRPDVVRFFRLTWIPDETFFQTLVRHLVPSDQIRARTLTFLIFTDYGMPVVFFNDHYDLLLSQDYLFARKVSPEAQDLRARLAALHAAPDFAGEVNGGGRRLYQFVADRGRDGLRYHPRQWEGAGSLGPGRTLMIVACKKWHVAKRLVASIRQRTNLTAFEYVFDEEGAALPALGGIATTLAKRGRHARALMRLVYDEVESRQMVICVDTARLDLIADMTRSGATVRVLGVDCHLDDAYLAGHARRIGLAGGDTPAGVIANLLPTVKADVTHEAERLRTAGLPHFYRIEEGAPLEENALAIAAFLDISHETAVAIAATDHLFTD